MSVNKPPSVVPVWQALQGTLNLPTHLYALLFIVCGAIISIVIVVMIIIIIFLLLLLFLNALSSIDPEG